MRSSPDGILILPNLNVQNTNTISSPITWGFPSITAILGFAHKLERRASVRYTNLKFHGVGIICHQFSPQVNQPNNMRDASFCLTRNPLDKNGEPTAFVEEGRAHMEVSLLIQVMYGEELFDTSAERENFAEDILNIAQALRIAGGSILPNRQSNTIKPQLIEWSNSSEYQKMDSRKILRRLLPGFVLISRDDLLADGIAENFLRQPQATALDVLLKFSSINYEPEYSEHETDIVEWNIVKKPGWIVPIPVGYSAISSLYAPGSVLNSRDPAYPFCFVENCYSLGEWLSPHRINYLDEIFWHYQVDNENGLYRCINNPLLTN